MVNLTENQWLTLFTVRDQGPVTVNDLSKITGEPDTGERTRLERFERLGYVSRQQVYGMGRTKQSWKITEAGKRAIAEATR
jgi:predicted ArsR family transcriptional regulator